MKHKSENEYKEQKKLEAFNMDIDLFCPICKRTYAECIKVWKTI